jgi:hypothetical protein
MSMLHQRLVIVAATAAALAALAPPRLVQAECSLPSIAYAPAPDSALPRNPTVYVFVPSWYADEPVAIAAHAGSAELPATMRRLGVAEDFVAYAVTIETGDARELSLRMATDREVNYRIDPHWAAPAERRATPVAALRRTSRWMCSWTDLWEISIDGTAPALRVEWATGKAAFARNEAEIVILPDRLRAFWGWPDTQNSAPVVALGHSSCFGYTIPSRAVHDQRFDQGGLFVRVTPLYADGSAGEPSAIIRVSELPQPIERPAPDAGTDVDKYEELAAVLMAPSVIEAAPVTEAPAPRTLAVTGRVWALAAASGVLLGLALALGWRRRRGLRVAVLAALAAPACAGLALLAGATAWPAWLAGAAATLGLAALVSTAARRRE